MGTSTVVSFAVLGFVLVAHCNAAVLHVYKGTHDSWHGGWDHGHWDHGKYHHDHGNGDEYDYGGRHDYDETHKHHSWEDCHDEEETTTDPSTILPPTTTTYTTTTTTPPPPPPAVIEIDDQLIQMDNSNSTVIDQDVETTQTPCKESYDVYDKEEEYWERHDGVLGGPGDDVAAGSQKEISGDAQNAASDSVDAESGPPIKVEGPASSDDDTLTIVNGVPSWRDSGIPQQAPSTGSSIFLVSKVQSVLSVDPSVTPPSSIPTTTAREPAPVVENDQLFNQLFSNL